MTKTEVRLALAQRQRRFEWELSREAQTRAAQKMITGKTHDMMNLVQIVQLATLELANRCDAGGQEFIEDLQRAARDAQVSLSQLMEVARPERIVTRGAPVGAAFTAAVNTIRPAIAIDEHLAVQAETVTECTADDIEHLVYGLVLDAADAPHIELYIRERMIDGKPWVEVVRGAEVPTEGDRFELRAVEAIAKRVGGEVATSDRRGGGTEVVVALPAL